MSNEQQNALVYTYSVKLETTAKGLVMPTVHVYSIDKEQVRKEAIELFLGIIDDLKKSGQQLATEAKA